MPQTLPSTGTTQRTLSIIMGRRRNAFVSAHQGPSKPAVPLGGKYQTGRYPDQQLPQLRAALDLCPDAIQQHVASSAHQASYKFDNFSRSSSNSRCQQTPEGAQCIRERPTRSAKTALLLEQPTIIPHPERRPPTGWIFGRSSISTFARAPRSPSPPPRQRTADQISGSC